MPTIKGFKMINGKMDEETAKKMKEAGALKAGFTADNWESDNNADLVKPTEQSVETMVSEPEVDVVEEEDTPKAKAKAKGKKKKK